MKRKSILRYRTDGKPIRTNLGGIYKHQIAVLAMLMVDNAESYSKVQQACESVIDDLYDNVDELKKSTYIQDLCNLVEQKVSKDLFFQGLLFLQTLVDVKANSEKAKNLIVELEKMLIELDTNQIDKDRFKSKMYRLNRLMKKNYKQIS